MEANLTIWWSNCIHQWMSPHQEDIFGRRLSLLFMCFIIWCEKIGSCIARNTNTHLVVHLYIWFLLLLFFVVFFCSWCYDYRITECGYCFMLGKMYPLLCCGKEWKFNTFHCSPGRSHITCLFLYFSYLWFHVLAQRTVVCSQHYKLLCDMIALTLLILPHIGISLQ